MRNQHVAVTCSYSKRHSSDVCMTLGQDFNQVLFSIVWFCCCCCCCCCCYHCTSFLLYHYTYCTLYWTCFRFIFSHEKKIATSFHLTSFPFLSRDVTASQSFLVTCFLDVTLQRTYKCRTCYWASMRLVWWTVRWERERTSKTSWRKRESVRNCVTWVAIYLPLHPSKSSLNQRLPSYFNICFPHLKYNISYCEVGGRQNRWLHLSVI